jgi:hypothetical protein
MSLTFFKRFYSITVTNLFLIAVNKTPVFIKDKEHENIPKFLTSASLKQHGEVYDAVSAFRKVIPCLSEAEVRNLGSIFVSRSHGI